MGFGPRAHELMLFVEGKNVVSQDVFFPVVLMESCALAAIDDIVLQNDSSAPLIRIKSPTAISERVHIMDQVVAHDRSCLRSECIYAAHVTEQAFADVVHVIELDHICAAG